MGQVISGNSKASIKKHYEIALFIMILTMVAVTAIAEGREKTDYSGRWIFNPLKSKLQIDWKPEKGEFEINHKEPLFRLHRIFIVDGKANEISFEHTTDGKEVVTTEGNRKIYSRMYWDGDILVLDQRILMGNREATNKVRYTLANGGATLIAEEQFRGPKLKYDNLWAADKVH